jgi:SNF2-related domain/Helicase conserved C-terminal domain
MAGTLRVGLTGTPPRAQFSRDPNVADELWNALGRNIAPGMPQLDDRCVNVPLERLMAARRWLAETLRVYGCAFDPTAAVRVLLARHDAEREEIDRALHTDPEPVSVAELLRESRFVRPLREFQQRDLTHLLALSHGANFSVPGAGKTTVSYALYEAERQRRGIERLLVIAPLSAFEAWVTEAKECFEPVPSVRALNRHPPAGCEILLVNYQKLGAARFGSIAEWVAGAPCQMILDEAHRVKRGRDGEWGAACLDLAHLAVRRDILTGTPAPQHPSDFQALLSFLWPQQATRILPPGSRQATPTAATMQQISQRLRPLFVRTRKHELGLLAPELRVELTEMKEIQGEIYTALRTRMSRALRAGGRDQVTLARMGAVSMYMLQAASNPALLARALGAPGTPAVQWPLEPIASDSKLGELVRDYSQREIPTKFDKLATLVAANAAAGRKTLVWTNFIDNLTELAERLLAPFQPAMIRGDVPDESSHPGQRSRVKELRRFRNDDNCMVLVANPAAMSEGVSLHQDCHDAVYLDRTFNAGQYLQSLDRIHRLGLAEDIVTRMTFLVSVGTIDEIVDRRLRTKAERLSQMLEDEDLVTMALPDEEEGYNDVIDPDDLEALFGHLRNDGQ